MNTPMPVSQQVARPESRRARLLRAAGWIAFALALAATFRAYLDPSLALDLGSFMQMCGLR